LLQWPFVLFISWAPRGGTLFSASHLAALSGE
jgi:hypothetical protein